MSSNITPFKGRIDRACATTRAVNRFVKSGHVAEIHERTVAEFGAVELIVFIDGELRYSQLFHGQQLTDYRPNVKARAKQFADKGWIEQPPSGH